MSENVKKEEANINDNGFSAKKVDKKDIDGNEEIVGVVPVDSKNVSWDELHATHKGMASDILDLQMLVVTMVKTNEQKIDSDPKLYAMVTGLMKSIDDVALELKETQDRYIGKGTGLIDKDDEEGNMLYVETLGRYIGIGEKFAVLSSTAITDIVTLINLDNNIIQTSIKVQTDIAKAVAENNK